MVVIVPNKEGYEPTQNVVRYLSRRAQKLGFIHRCAYVLVLADGALLLEETEDRIEALIAAKKRGRWKFMTEREYYES